MKHIDYRTSGTCAQLIHFDVEDGKVYNVSFDGGCNGNLKAIAKLAEGQTIDFVVDTLKGNTCGLKSTSCADQLAKALEAANA